MDIQIIQLREKKNKRNEMNRITYKKRKEAGTNKNIKPLDQHKPKGRKIKPISAEEIIKIQLKKPNKK